MASVPTAARGMAWPSDSFRIVDRVPTGLSSELDQISACCCLSMWTTFFFLVQGHPIPVGKRGGLPSLTGLDQVVTYSKLAIVNGATYNLPR